MISTKEHKFQFQFSTNTHQELARFMFGTYLGLGVLWMLLIPRFGLLGLVWCWFAVESAQLGYLIYLNARFFAHHEPMDKRYLVRLAVLSISFLTGAWVCLPYTRQMALPVQIGIAVANGVALLALAIPLYDLGSVWVEFQARRRGKRLA